MITNVFPKQLFKLRTKAKLTQLEVANSVGISRSAYSCYENGSRKPEFEKLLKIANFFNVSLDYLVHGDEFKMKSKSQGEIDLNNFIKDLEQVIDIYKL